MKNARLDFVLSNLGIHFALDASNFDLKSIIFSPPLFFPIRVFLSLQSFVFHKKIKIIDLFNNVIEQI